MNNLRKKRHFLVKDIEKIFNGISFHKNHYFLFLLGNLEYLESFLKLVILHLRKKCDLSLIGYDQFLKKIDFTAIHAKTCVAYFP